MSSEKIDPTRLRATALCLSSGILDGFNAWSAIVGGPVFYKIINTQSGKELRTYFSFSRDSSEILQRYLSEVKADDPKSPPFPATSSE